MTAIPGHLSQSRAGVWRQERFSSHLAQGRYCRSCRSSKPAWYCWLCCRQSGWGRLRQQQTLYESSWEIEAKTCSHCQFLLDKFNPSGCRLAPVFQNSLFSSFTHTQLFHSLNWTPKFNVSRNMGLERTFRTVTPQSNPHLKFIQHPFKSWRVQRGNFLTPRACWETVPELFAMLIRPHPWSWALTVYPGHTATWRTWGIRSGDVYFPQAMVAPETVTQGGSSCRWWH